MRPDGTGAQGARGSIGEWTGRRPAGAVTPAAAAVGIPGPPHQSTADAANHPAPTACGDRGGRTSRRSRRTGCTGSGRCARRAVRQRRNSWRRRRGEGLAPSPRASGVKMCGGERRRTIRPVGVHGKGHPDTNPAQGPHGEGCPRGTADHHLGDSRPGDGGIQKGASPLTAPGQATTAGYATGESVARRLRGTHTHGVRWSRNTDNAPQSSHRVQRNVLEREMKHTARPKHQAQTTSWRRGCLDTRQPPPPGSHAATILPRHPRGNQCGSRRGNGDSNRDRHNSDTTVAAA
jgi:hypothetical protein